MIPTARLGHILGLFAIGSLAACAPVPAVDGPAATPAAVHPAAQRTCVGGDPAGFARCVDEARWLADVQRIVGARPPGSRHHREVASLCADTLAAHGFTVEMERFATGVNVVGTLPGREPTRVVLGAHYDSVAGCPGADDNASGVAGLLEITRVLAGHRFDRTLVAICFDDEENGLRGSLAWVDAHADEAPIDIAFVFDGIGVRRTDPHSQAIPTGFDVLFPGEVERLRARDFRGDFIAVIADTPATPRAERIAVAAAAGGVPAAVLALDRLWLHVPIATDLRRSDHAPFWDAGVPAVLLTDTADFRTPSYHCREAPDDVHVLSPAFAREVVSATTDALVHALGRSRGADA